MLLCSWVNYDIIIFFLSSLLLISNLLIMKWDTNLINYWLIILYSDIRWGDHDWWKGRLSHFTSLYFHILKISWASFISDIITGWLSSYKLLTNLNTLVWSISCIIFWSLKSLKFEMIVWQVGCRSSKKVFLALKLEFIRLFFIYTRWYPINFWNSIFLFIDISLVYSVKCSCHQVVSI